MKKSREKTQSLAYAARVADINRIYDKHCRSGLSNREIFRRYIYPQYYICERTFYNCIKASTDERITRKQRLISPNGDLFNV